MIDLDKAQKQILDATPVLGRESVPILESLGRIPYPHDIVSIEDFPPSNISALDGYAFRHADLQPENEDSPVRLKIIGESPAGRPFGAAVNKGEAVRIMTGGVVPDGSDTIVKIEHATEKDGAVSFSKLPHMGSGIRGRGEALKEGDTVLWKGSIIGPLEIGALATLRRAYVSVYRKPLVAIMATGDELSDFHEPPLPGKAMCSNLYSLAAQVLEAGGVPLCIGIVRDNLDQQHDRMAEALRADVIITSGGTSRGKYDFIHKAFSSLGLEMRFSSIFAKPGKPTIFGTIGKSLIFGLPGNPSATMLSFDQFIRPALLKMMGHPNVLKTCRDHADRLSENDPFTFIDSFHIRNGGNKEHRRGAQVPLGRNRYSKEASGRKTTVEDTVVSDGLKIAAH